MLGIERSLAQQLAPQWNISEEKAKHRTTGRPETHLLKWTAFQAGQELGVPFRQKCVHARRTHLVALAL
jgi:hypothetical protein